MLQLYSRNAWPTGDVLFDTRQHREVRVLGINLGSKTDDRGGTTCPIPDFVEVSPLSVHEDENVTEAAIVTNH